MAADLKELVARLRRHACGTVEWRVADPATGNYIIGFDSEPKAREWLADHVKRFPNSMHADKAVTRVLYRTALERAALEAADLLERLDTAL